MDYKNVNQLRRYISEKGKIRNRRITGACRRHQRQVAVAVKRAREMALLPYVAGVRDGGHPAPATSRSSACKGEVVNVEARLRPQLPAAPASSPRWRRPGRVAEIRRIDEERARHEARSAEQAAEIAATLEKTVLRFEVKSGPTGALFGSVTPTDIAEEIWRTRKIRVDRRKIDLDVDQADRPLHDPDRTSSRASPPR